MPHAMPVATLSPLHRADGSAKYSSNGYSVIAAVNGPVEVQRRDELPEEAVVDVAIHPVSGVGGRLSRSTVKCCLTFQARCTRKAP